MLLQKETAARNFALCLYLQRENYRSNRSASYRKLLFLSPGCYPLLLPCQRFIWNIKYRSLSPATFYRYATLLSSIFFILRTGNLCRWIIGYYYLHSVLTPGIWLKCYFWIIYCVTIKGSIITFYLNRIFLVKIVLLLRAFFVERSIDLHMYVF